MAEPELPSELMIHVLSWLPVKTLKRFKCVSKRWNSLISDPWFLNLHRQRSTQNQFLYITSQREEENCGRGLDNRLRFAIVDSQGKILREFTKDCGTNLSPDLIEHVYSCNGLICFSTMTWRSFQHIYLLNPETQDLLLLPTRESHFLSDAAFGFGYLSSTREYKVMRMACYWPGDIRCEVLSFTSSPGIWSQSLLGSSFRVVLDKWPYRCTSRSVFVHGWLHWLTGRYALLVSFDLESENFRTLVLPLSTRTSAKIYLADLGGNLGLVDHLTDAPFWKIWMLKDYEKCIWIILWKIDLRPIIVDPLPALVKMKFICMNMMDEELLIVRRSQNRIIHNFYSLKNQSFRKVEVHGDVGFPLGKIVCF